MLITNRPRCKTVRSKLKTLIADKDLERYGEDHTYHVLVKPVHENDTLPRLTDDCSCCAPEELQYLYDDEPHPRLSIHHDKDDFFKAVYDATLLENTDSQGSMIPLEEKELKILQKTIDDEIAADQIEDQTKPTDWTNHGDKMAQYLDDDDSRIEFISENYAFLNLTEVKAMMRNPKFCDFHGSTNQVPETPEELMQEALTYLLEIEDWCRYKKFDFAQKKYEIVKGFQDYLEETKDENPVSKSQQPRYRKDHVKSYIASNHPFPPSPRSSPGSSQRDGGLLPHGGPKPQEHFK
jgi:hypothetical protein